MWHCYSCNIIFECVVSFDETEEYTIWKHKYFNDLYNDDIKDYAKREKKKIQRCPDKIIIISTKYKDSVFAFCTEKCLKTCKNKIKNTLLESETMNLNIFVFVYNKKYFCGLNVASFNANVYKDKTYDEKIKFYIENMPHRYVNYEMYVSIGKIFSMLE
jgi:hypothetical protein